MILFNRVIYNLVIKFMSITDHQPSSLRSRQHENHPDYIQRSSCSGSVKSLSNVSYNQLQKCWDTLAKNNLSCFKSLLVTGLWGKILTSLLPPFKVVPPSFEHGLVLLATLKRGGGEVTSTRSWTGHLSQNMVECLKYFCSWL